MGFEEKLHFFISNEKLFPAYARNIINKDLLIYFKIKTLNHEILIAEQTLNNDIDHFADLYGLREQMFNHKVEHLLNV